MPQEEAIDAATEFMDANGFNCPFVVTDRCHGPCNNVIAISHQPLEIFEWITNVCIMPIADPGIRKCFNGQIVNLAMDNSPLFDVQKMKLRRTMSVSERKGMDSLLDDTEIFGQAVAKEVLDELKHYVLSEAEHGIYVPVIEKCFAATNAVWNWVDVQDIIAKLTDSIAEMEGTGKLHVRFGTKFAKKGDYILNSFKMILENLLAYGDEIKREHLLLGLEYACSLNGGRKKLEAVILEEIQNGKKYGKLANVYFQTSRSVEFCKINVNPRCYRELQNLCN